jgi:hypothetical protein
MTRSVRAGLAALALPLPPAACGPHNPKPQAAAPATTAPRVVTVAPRRTSTKDVDEGRRPGVEEQPNEKQRDAASWLVSEVRSQAGMPQPQAHDSRVTG